MIFLSIVIALVLGKVHRFIGGAIWNLTAGRGNRCCFDTFLVLQCFRKLFVSDMFSPPFPSYRNILPPLQQTNLENIVSKGEIENFYNLVQMISFVCLRCFMWERQWLFIVCCWKNVCFGESCFNYFWLCECVFKR